VKEEESKVILKVDMHCEGCKGKVRKALIDIVGKSKKDYTILLLESKKTM
jgi:copper chaperone CopZ